MYRITSPTNFFDAVDHILHHELAPRINQNFFKVLMTESEEKYTVKAEIPGVNKQDISVEFNKDNRLVISVESTQKHYEENEKVIHNEFRSLKSSRSVYFSEAVDKENVKASYENGLLILHVPKSKQGQNSNKIVIE